MTQPRNGIEQWLSRFVLLVSLGALSVTVFAAVT